MVLSPVEVVYGHAMEEAKEEQDELSCPNSLQSHGKKVHFKTLRLLNKVITIKETHIGSHLGVRSHKQEVFCPKSQKRDVDDCL